MTEKPRGQISAERFQAKEFLTISDQAFKEMEEDQRGNILNHALNMRPALERNDEFELSDRIISRVEEVVELIDGDADDLRRQDWERNHHKVLNAINSLMTQYSTFPTISTISETAKLSRQTVQKHINAGIKNKYHRGEFEKFAYLASDVLGRLYNLAISKNDVRAAKVFLDNVYQPQTRFGPSIRQQNNFIQLNKTIISEAVINSLPGDARDQIEKIIAANYRLEPEEKNGG